MLQPDVPPPNPTSLQPVASSNLPDNNTASSSTATTTTQASSSSSPQTTYLPNLDQAVELSVLKTAQQISMSLSIISIVADCIMVVGTSPGWVVQLRSVLHRGSAGGFSWQMALLLLSCYTLRVGYYFGEHFHISLLLQCMVMILIVISLIAAIVDAPDSATPLMKYQYPHHPDRAARYEKHLQKQKLVAVPEVNESTQVTEEELEEGSSNNRFFAYIHSEEEEEHLRELHPWMSEAKRKFDKLFKQSWAGGSYYFGFLTWGGPNTKYVYGIYGFILLSTCFICSRTLPQNRFLTHVIGFIALGVEASVVFPQVYLNEVNRSVEGLSKFLVGTWFFGDLMKVLYFLAKSQPAPFVACGVTQFLVDLYIIGQFSRFGKNSNQKGLVNELGQMEGRTITASQNSGKEHHQHGINTSMNEESSSTSVSRHRRTESAPLHQLHQTTRSGSGGNRQNNIGTNYNNNNNGGGVDHRSVNIKRNIVRYGK